MQYRRRAHYGSENKLNDGAEIEEANKVDERSESVKFRTVL